MWITLISAGLKLVGLADLAASLVKSWQDRQAGKEIQRQTDTQAENAVLSAELKASVAAPKNVKETAAVLGDGRF